MILGVIEYALTFDKVSQAGCLVVIRSILDFLYSFSSEIKKNFDLGMKVINYAFKAMEVQDLLPIAADLFSEAAKKLPQILDSYQFEAISKKVFALCEKAVPEQAVQNLISGLFNLTESSIGGKPSIDQKEIILNFVTFSLSKFVQTEQKSFEPGDLRKCIKLLLATFSSINHQFELLHEARLGRPSSPSS